MSLQRLETDSPESGEAGIPDPSWELVEREIRALDGEWKDTLSMYLRDDAYMTIAGGNENRYIIFGQLSDHHTFVCASGADDRSKKEVAACRDLIPYDSANVVDLTTALAAAKVFYDSGEFRPDLKWEPDPRQ